MLLSPKIALLVGYIYVVIISCLIGSSGFYSNNTFFNWGPPITFFNVNVHDQTTFYIIHLTIFVHQIVNNWINSVVYPWILNDIQNRKNRDMLYSASTSLLLINLFDIYSELDVVFIIGGFSSQISFVITLICANLITSTHINYKHIKAKKSIDYVEIV